MSGILFLRTKKYHEIQEFYVRKIGCGLWLDQGSCVIFRHGNQLIGFCDRDEADTGGVLTFFYPTKKHVDEVYEAIKDSAESPPKMNEQYRIYHFYARDPEGRSIEFQTFDHHVYNHLAGDELLLTRRSVREFAPVEVADDLILDIINLSRFAPTSRNTQSYYFKIIRERNLLKKLSEVRGKSSAPISGAPLAVAICSDPELSKRHVQDGCIGAYHFILASWCYGLGTVWIAAMDRQEVKHLLNVPDSHYVATVTPLGYPAKFIEEAPPRKEIDYYIRPL